MNDQKAKTDDVRVWLVRELAVHLAPYTDSEGKPKTVMVDDRVDSSDLFVLAKSAAEAAAIVGETGQRRIILIQEVCPLSKLPGDKYRVEPF